MVDLMLKMGNISEIQYFAEYSLQPELLGVAEPGSEFGDMNSFVLY